MPSLAQLSVSSERDNTQERLYCCFCERLFVTYPGIYQHVKAKHPALFPTYKKRSVKKMLRKSRAAGGNSIYRLAKLPDHLVNSLTSAYRLPDHLANSPPEHQVNPLPEHQANPLPEHLAISLPEHLAISLPEHLAISLPSACQLPEHQVNPLPWACQLKKAAENEQPKPRTNQNLP